MEFFTLGVFNSTEKEFFEKLTKNNIDTFCDIRQRRGVRGSKYSYVNSNRLQQKLTELDIKYGYIQDLAPSAEIREMQKNADLENGESKSERTHLSNNFIFEYKERVLAHFNFDNFLESLDQIGASRVTFFCVEEFPEACHRSIVANKLIESYNFQVTHL